MCRLTTISHWRAAGRSRRIKRTRVQTCGGGPGKGRRRAVPAEPPPDAERPLSTGRDIARGLTTEEPLRQSRPQHLLDQRRNLFRRGLHWSSGASRRTVLVDFAQIQRWRGTEYFRRLEESTPCSPTPTSSTPRCFRACRTVGAIKQFISNHAVHVGEEPTRPSVPGRYHLDSDGKGMPSSTAGFDQPCNCTASQALLLPGAFLLARYQENSRDLHNLFRGHQRVATCRPEPHGRYMPGFGDQGDTVREV